MGLAYTAVALLALPITNAGLNPARSTGGRAVLRGLGRSASSGCSGSPRSSVPRSPALAHRAFATDAGTDNLLEEDDLLVDEDSLLDDDIEDVAVERR